MRRRLDAAGYQEVKTPQLLDRSLWEKSGHWENYRQHMFITQVQDEDKFLALKPMSCPCHIQIFRQGMRSYRELPLRMAEFGLVPPLRTLRRAARHHARAANSPRTTPTSSAPRTRSPRKPPASSTLLSGVYNDFGFPDFRIKFADRPGSPHRQR